MPLPQVECSGLIQLDNQTMYRECVKVKKVFDEFVLRECVEGIEFETDEENQDFNGFIEPTLILRDCEMTNSSIMDISKTLPNNPNNIENRLRLLGDCKCKVYAKDLDGNMLRLKVKNIPSGSTLSKGTDGELIMHFSVKRTYPDVSKETFERFLHFVDQGNFELEFMGEAIIDEENNEIREGVLLTNFGMFSAIKLDTEVQLCIPVLGYCEITDEYTDEDFCDNFDVMDVPNFNPPQLDGTDPYSG